MRKPFQGVGNIVRFNWHFFALSFIVLLIASALYPHASEDFQKYVAILCLLLVASTLIPLLVSYYIYDTSDLYKLNWLEGFGLSRIGKIANINAGFDETSVLLKEKFPEAELIVFDFYNPLYHTEVSIKRARKAYPPYPNTQVVLTSVLPLPDDCLDTIFIVFAAHEIRNAHERVIFFNEIKRVLKPTGRIVLTEHLRDLPNFLAYNIGFFHFLSRNSWLDTFQKTDLRLKTELKITTFVSTFLLEKK
jgi:SAM-dependent methyltransferase